MKLFQRIFATFCLVIVFAISVVSISFFILQSRLTEKQTQQLHEMEISQLHSVYTVFQSQGEHAARDMLMRSRKIAATRNIRVIIGSSTNDLLNRPVSEEEIKQAYKHLTDHPDSDTAKIYYDPFGEEVLFFLKPSDKTHPDYAPGIIIPGLPLAPVWHEFIIFATTLAVGLLLAYILATNISKPIAILENGMKRLAAGELDARVSQQLDERKDELAHLGIHFDRMADQLQKLVTKERHLLHHVSHEMRSPLARIQAIIGLMQARPEKSNDYIARLESELSRMDTLVGELLTLSRLETANIPMDKELMPIVPFMRHLVEDSQSLAEQRGYSILLDTGNLSDKARFKANESYLYRAFDNVIRNAINYSPTGSTITVSMHEDRKNLHIEISDNGPGIKEEQLPHIFTAFYRADSSANISGTGLGLAITKHITEQHEGKLIAENLQPNGLKMHFIFPKTCKIKEKGRHQTTGDCCQDNPPSKQAA